MIDWLLPLELVSHNRQKTEHWSKQYARDKHNKQLIEKRWAEEQPTILPPCHIRLTRLYNPRIKQKEMDEDNLIPTFKGIRDTLAGILVPRLAPGQADNKKHGIVFHYDQQKSDRPYCRITIASPEDYEKLCNEELLLRSVFK